MLTKSVRAPGPEASARFSRWLPASFLACIAAWTMLAPHAQAAPIINIALLARPTGTTQAFSSTITNPAVNSTWDYEVVYTLLGSPGNFPIANASLTTQIAGYRKSTPTSLTTGDGFQSASFCLQQPDTNQIQTTFDLVNAGNAAAYANYPTGLPRPDGGNGSVSYTTANQITSGTVWAPASPVALAYNNGASSGGTPVARGNGNMDLGNSPATADFAGRIGGTYGVSAANTPVQNVPIGNGVFTITSVGTGATSTVTPSWKGLSPISTLLGIRYLNGSNSQIAANLPVGSQSDIFGYAVADPIATITPLILSNSGVGVSEATYHFVATASASTIMRGDTTSVTATVVNDNYANQDAIVVNNQSLTASGNAYGSVSGSALPAVGTQTLALNSSYSNSGLILSGNDYGNAVVSTSASIVPSITGVTLHHTVDAVATINVGIVSPNNGGTTNGGLTSAVGSGVISSVFPAGTTYGSGSQTVRFGTKTNGTGTNGIATTAELLDGTAGSYTGGDNTGGGSHAAGSRTIRMTWRTRASSELPSSPSLTPGPKFGVKSDVVQLSGLDGLADIPNPTEHRHTDKFVLQMSVSDAAFGGSHTALQAAIQHGFLYLGWLDDTSATTSTHGGLPLWRNAVNGNFINETGLAKPDDATGYVGSYASYYQGTRGIGQTTKSANSFRIDDWGVQDLGEGSGAYVWAVLDHNSIFAAVPEPSTIVMFGFGLLGALALVVRRRTKALPFD